MPNRREEIFDALLHGRSPVLELTKREWFAGLAMQALIRNQTSERKWENVRWEEDVVAECAFSVADAMLDASREKKS